MKESNKYFFQDVLTCTWKENAYPCKDSEALFNRNTTSTDEETPAVTETAFTTDGLTFESTTLNSGESTEESQGAAVTESPESPSTEPVESTDSTESFETDSTEMTTASGVTDLPGEGKKCVQGRGMIKVVSSLCNHR